MARRRSAGKPQPEIPNRVYFKIGEVCKIAGVESHVLRFWESEFPTLKPGKTPKGHRRYKRKDVELVLAIKRLLYEERYTIAGARKALWLYGKEPREPVAEDLEAAPPESLAAIRAELEEISTLLEPSPEVG